MLVGVNLGVGGWVVSWIEQGGGCGTWVSDVLCLVQVGGMRIRAQNSLLQGRCGLLQENFEFGWIYNCPGAPSLTSLRKFSCLIGAVPI